MTEYFNEILDLFLFIVIGLLLGQLFVHYYEHLEHSKKYSYFRYVGTITMMLVVSYISLKNDARWNTNIVTEFIPFVVPMITTILYVALSLRGKKKAMGSGNPPEK